MKTAILLHGTGGSSENYFWFADTKKYLEANGYEVWWPLLPNTEKPELQETMHYVEQNLPTINENTIIIGHSSACPLILHIVQYFKVKIKQVVLVGGFYKSLNDDGYSDLMLPKSFDWEVIKSKVDEIILINSNNDPWGCNDMQAREPAIKLSATLAIASGQGHMGSLSYNQSYKEFPLLKRLLRVKQ
ncbi:hypothetical protein EB118_01595 [bacterium]|nr:hypothetical protein [bacterium]NBX98527.1 hypothetical protein [bacterium]NDC93837.1 hypothetical protein [bacterium]NDD84206.1 hypothetical protein [bacterium]NDG28783.1 hypothetical protein [bacterium]